MSVDTAEPDEGPVGLVQAGEHVMTAGTARGRNGALDPIAGLESDIHERLNEAAMIGYRKGLEDAVREFREACSKAEQWEEDDPRLKYVNVQLDKGVYFILFPEED